MHRVMELAREVRRESRLRKVSLLFDQHIIFGNTAEKEDNSRAEVAGSSSHPTGCLPHMLQKYIYGNFANSEAAANLHFGYLAFNVAAHLFTSSTHWKYGLLVLNLCILECSTYFASRICSTFPKYYIRSICTLACWFFVETLGISPHSFCNKTSSTEPLVVFLLLTSPSHPEIARSHRSVLTAIVVCRCLPGLVTRVFAEPRNAPKDLLQMLVYCTACFVMKSLLIKAPEVEVNRDVLISDNDSSKAQVSSKTTERYSFLTAFLEHNMDLLSRVSGGAVLLLTETNICFWATPNCSHIFGEDECLLSSFSEVPNLGRHALRLGALSNYVLPADTAIFESLFEAATTVFEEDQTDHQFSEQSHKTEKTLHEVTDSADNLIGKRLHNSAVVRLLKGGIHGSSETSAATAQNGALEAASSEHLIYCELSVSIYKKDPKIFVCSLRDVSAQVRHKLVVTSLLEALSESYKTAAWAFNHAYFDKITLEQCPQGSNKSSAQQFNILVDSNNSNAWVASKVLKQLTGRRCERSEDGNVLSPEDDWMQYIFEPDRVQLFRAMRELMDLYVPFQTEIRYEKPDGHISWFKAAGHVVCHPSPIFWGLFQDVTEEKMQTSKLERELSKLKALLGAEFDGYGVIDAQEGCILEASSNLVDIMGRELVHGPSTCLVPQPITNNVTSGGRCRNIPVKLISYRNGGRESVPAHATVCTDPDDAGLVLYGISTKLSYISGLGFVPGNKDDIDEAD